MCTLYFWLVLASTDARGRRGCKTMSLPVLADPTYAPALALAIARDELPTKWLVDYMDNNDMNLVVSRLVGMQNLRVAA